MAVVCRLLDDANRYERTVSGWVDVLAPGLLRLGTRQSDHRSSVDVSLDATPSPAFDVARAAGTWRSPEPGGDRQDLSDRLSRLAGLQLVPGFRRRVVEALGPEDPRTPFVTDAVIEAARLSRQVTQVDERQVPAKPTPRDLRQLDLAAWPEFADMCFTYSPASSALFDGPDVRVPASLDMYVPRPGTRFAFHRYKRAAVELSGGVLRLYQSMFDQVHGFELWYDVDVETRRILRARSLTPRLPYMGICDQVQGRHQALVGLALDERWPVTMREATAGSHGCFQLADLTADLFRLLSLE
jgi:hypothetical protein